MDAVKARSGAHRGDLVLPRFLAVVLFLLAALIGLPVTLTAGVALMTKDGRAFGLMAAVAPVVAMLVWLGRRLWTGRPIPAWFTNAACVLGFLVLIAFQVANGAWVLTLLLVPWPLAIVFARHPPSAKPATALRKPDKAPWDDELA
jgi:hypothetical protein